MYCNYNFIASAYNFLAHNPAISVPVYCQSVEDDYSPFCISTMQCYFSTIADFLPYHI